MRHIINDPDIVKYCCAPNTPSPNMEMCPHRIKYDEITDGKESKRHTSNSPATIYEGVFHQNPEKPGIPMIVRSYDPSYVKGNNIKILYETRNDDDGSGFVQCMRSNFLVYIVSYAWVNWLYDDTWRTKFRNQNPYKRLLMYRRMMKMLTNFANHGFVHTMVRPENIMIDDEDLPHLIGFSKAVPVKTKVEGKKFSFFMNAEATDQIHEAQHWDDYYGLAMTILWLENRKGFFGLEYGKHKDQFLEGELLCVNGMNNDYCETMMRDFINDTLGKSFGYYDDKFDENNPRDYKKITNNLTYQIYYMVSMRNFRTPDENLADFDDAIKNYLEEHPEYKDKKII